MAVKRILRQLNETRDRLQFTLKQGMEMPISRDTSYYVHCTKHQRLDPRLVFYESHNGAGVVCNPAAIFRSLLASSVHSSLRHVWSVDSESELQRLANEYSGHANVRFVLRESRSYLRALATAKWLVQNTSFPSYFFKRDGQIYLNTWHSITVKTLGYDIPDGNLASRNMVRNLLMTDYLLSPNSFMTEIFRNSFRLQGLFPGRVLEFGYPRNDTTLNASRRAVIEGLRARGLNIDPNRQLILYAPTWRGTSVGQVEDGTADLERLRSAVETGIDTSRYQLVIKPHQYHFNAMSEDDQHSGKYVPRHIDANELLAVTDLLISDYSSIFLDFTVTGRPVLFYVPDLAEYKSTRGVYFDFDQLPGPVSEDASDVVAWINDIDRIAEQYREAREETRTWACTHDDGSVSERVIRAVFQGDLDQPGVHSDFTSPQKKRLLFYGAGFANNGVTAALLALLPHLDREKYDITVYGAASKGVSTRSFEKLTDVRAMARTGPYALTRFEAFGLQYVKRYGLSGPLARLLRPEKTLERDFFRCFGGAAFDYVIDYSGYAALVPATFAQHRGAVKIVWQHGDLGAELQNQRKKKLEMYRDNPLSKTGLMDIYAAFDRIVACGEAVMQVNRKAFSTSKTKRKFTYVNNVIDAKRVRELAAVDSLIELNGPKIVASRTAGNDGSVQLHLVPNDPPAPTCGEPFLKFVTMGRLSPEKNHENLLRGFAEFAADHPNSRLYIIGAGPLEKRLRTLVARLDLGGLVTLTGALENPFSVIKHCDCFILPSRHEGNPITVAEVRMLGLPIILSRFESAPSACIPNGQHLIGFSSAEIRKGLDACLAGLVPTDYKFDVDSRNAEAVAQFENLLRTVTVDATGPKS